LHRTEIKIKQVGRKRTELLPLSQYCLITEKSKEFILMAIKNIPIKNIKLANLLKTKVLIEFSTAFFSRETNMAEINPIASIPTKN
jgi:hypothetical protein